MSLPEALPLSWPPTPLKSLPDQTGIFFKILHKTISSIDFKQLAKFIMVHLNKV